MPQRFTKKSNNLFVYLSVFESSWQELCLFAKKRSIEVVDSLCLEDLQRPLHPTEIPHPIAKNKFDALDWNIKHTMWHCGQLGILVRIVDERFDFGLRREQA
jgi:hypothetical protein